MQLSADGSVSVGRIVWRGWGSGRAVGSGTAKVDTCIPNCAQGSYDYYPASIVLTDPKAWAGWLVYSSAPDSVSAAHTGMKCVQVG